MKPAQYGALVQHCMTLDRFNSIKVCKTSIEISFSLADQLQVVDSAKIQTQLQADVEALADLDPFPCPCGCGAYIAISPCHRQSGIQPDSFGLTPAEMSVAQTDKIGAIKMVRLRTGCGLKEAKDFVVNYCESMKQ
jgi:hypothetical protein